MSSTVQTKDSLTLLENVNDFSLVMGGPLYQLYLRTHLSKPSLELLRRRVIVIALFCWAPLLVLSVAAGQATGGVAVPFLTDVEVHIRFLAALPLLIIAEVFVHRRIVIVVRQFLERKIIASEDLARFERIIASTMHIRNSPLLEVALLVFCFTIGHWVWREQMALTIPTWYSANHGGTTLLSKAGYWYVFVSLPIFRFLLFRWYFRLLLWYQFLWRVRGLPLHLNLYHPDCSAGLGFLSASIPAFAPMLLAQTMLLAGMIGDRIWHAGATLFAFKMEIVGLLLLLIVIVLLPLSFFAPHLEHAARTASREFGILSSHYADSFRGKWVQHTSPETEPLLGTPDLQSLADLSHSFQSVSRIRLFPFGKDAVIRLTGMLLVPLLPLILTIMPLKEILDWVIKLAF